MAAPPPDSDDEDLALPARLRADLTHLAGHTPRVPAGRDDEILSAARAGFARRQRFRMFARAAAAVGSVAAAVAVVVFVNVRQRGPSAPTAVTTAPQMQPRPGDADRSGRIDILDAFVLARKIDAAPPAPAPPDPSHDVNRDGVLDRRDVDAVAALAVALPSTTLQ